MLMSMTTGFAQTPVSVIDSLDIEIWPDYDRASVLVLLTGTLPGDTRFPVSVTLPLPEAAQLNAVARIDSKDGNMMADIVSSTDPAGTLTFITSDLRFVQRPASASTLNTEPAAANVVKSEDGFDYHIFPARAVPAGKPFPLYVDYKMITAQLSATSLPRQNTNIQTPAIPTTPSTGLSSASLLIHGLKDNRGLNSAAIVASQSMKVTDSAAVAAQNYKVLFVSPEVLGQTTL
jgi:hypothetical protein